jgi:hypothetical protein
MDEVGIQDIALTAEQIAFHNTDEGIGFFENEP